MTKIFFGNTEEEILLKNEYPKDFLADILKNKAIGIIGYGPVGKAMALNLRDGGFNVLLGQRTSGKGWQSALEDGWEINHNLFEDFSYVVEKSEFIGYLLSDSGQKDQWQKVIKYFRPSQTLFFAHGFSIVYQKYSEVIPPSNIDVVLVAPKGAGVTLRKNFLNKQKMGAGIAVHQDSSGTALANTIALSFAIGFTTLYPTSFEKEVLGDLVGERGVLIGAIAALMKVQYEILRKNGLSPSEAFNETVEEATQSIYPIIGERGLDGLLEAASTTAQVGAIEWANRFEEVLHPLFKDLIERVKDGTEVEKVLDVLSQPQALKNLKKEIQTVRDTELWKVGESIRRLRC